MDAAAIPLPRPDKTPPVTMMYFVGMFFESVWAKNDKNSIR